MTEWPNGHSGPIIHGEWAGCWAHVYRDDVGEGWHIEIEGVPESGGKSVHWDSWFENRSDVLSTVEDLGLQ